MVQDMPDVLHAPNTVGKKIKECCEQLLTVANKSDSLMGNPEQRAPGNETKTKMTTATDIKSAIARSVSHNEIVKVELPGNDFREEVFAALTEIRWLGLSEDYDSATENDGSEDVWGTTKDGSFRLRLVSAK